MLFDFNYAVAVIMLGSSLARSCTPYATTNHCCTYHSRIRHMSIGKIFAALSLYDRCQRNAPFTGNGVFLSGYCNTQDFNNNINQSFKSNFLILLYNYLFTNYL